MPSFKNRSYQKELLDGKEIPFEDIRQNMKELDLINRVLGGHRITLEGIQSFSGSLKEKETIRIVEIGCGGGDNLRVIEDWSKKRGLKIHLTGIDWNQECIAYATTIKANKDIEFIYSDYAEVKFIASPHIIFSSLFCHHFTDKGLVFMLRWMKGNSSVGFFINDLHRHPVAYYFIKWVTRIFSKSYLVKNDAPLSVQRGFLKRDWQQLFYAAGMAPFTCRWKWAFRWLVTYKND